MKKILTFVFLASILSLTFVSATAFDFAKEAAVLPENQFTASEEVCSSFKYNFYTRWLDGFIFEVKTTNTEEDFFLVMHENDCSWNIEVIEEITKRPDMLVTGEWSEDNTQYPYLDNQQFQSKTLKGMIFGGLAKEFHF